jgi:hypothetical protein
LSVAFPRRRIADRTLLGSDFPYLAIWCSSVAIERGTAVKQQEIADISDELVADWILQQRAPNTFELLRRSFGR